MKSGIYAIICRKTWRSYVGSSVDIDERLAGHFQCFRRKSHDNMGLQSDFNKYGEASFVTEVVDECIVRYKSWMNKE